MKQYRSLLMFVVIACSSISFTKADEVKTVGAEIGEWTQDYEAAVKLAAEKEIPILMNFTGSDWCHWCIHMDKKVFSGAAWKDYAKQNLVLITLDFPKDKSRVIPKYAERNHVLQQKYGVRGYPTFVVLDSDAETVLGMLQAGEDKTPESFAKETGELLRMSKKGIEKYKQENPAKADEFQATIDSFKSLEKEWKEWVETKPEKNDANMQKHQDYMAKMQAAYKKMKQFK